MRKGDASVKLLNNISDLNHLEYLRNLTPYVFTFGLIENKRVLDLGVGTGSGSFLYFCHHPRQLISADLDQEKVKRIRRSSTTIPWYSVVLDAQYLSFAAKSFDVIACFEVIEHVPDPELTISGLNRLLADDGVLLMTTPNRDVRLLPRERPTNPEHYREYTANKFMGALQKEFQHVKLMGIYGQKEHYERYRKRWHPSLSRSAGRFLWRVSKKISLKKESLVQKKSPSYPSLTKELVGDIIPTGWPFYPLPKVKDCLNFLAICGNDSVSVMKIYDQIMTDSESAASDHSVNV